MHFVKNAKKIEDEFKTLNFGDYELEVINTPGHTPGSICILEKKTKTLFSGDTLFDKGIYGRTDLGGSEIELKKSIKKLYELDWKILCPGHGQITKRK
jgi:glyoxylase-like metal-dependent hydrolase (beta-lactamase superfamily II)